MKNCPWFSLRSNSIESRFRSIRRGNFLVYVFVNLRKSKSKIKSNSEFASLIELFYSLRSVQAQFSACDLRLFRLHSLKSGFSGSLGANFSGSLVDTRSIDTYTRLKMAFFSPLTKLCDEMIVFVMKWLKSQMRAKQSYFYKDKPSPLGAGFLKPLVCTYLYCINSLKISLSAKTTNFHDCRIILRQFFR